MRSLASIVVLSIAALDGALAIPTLKETFTGANFLQNFDHQAIADPTHGRVYVSQKPS
jgi:hypothetical protein